MFSSEPVKGYNPDSDLKTIKKNVLRYILAPTWRVGSSLFKDKYGVSVKRVL